MSLRYLAATIYVTVFEHRALSVKFTKHQCTFQVDNIKLTCMQMLYIHSSLSNLMCTLYSPAKLCSHIVSVSQSTKLRCEEKLNTHTHSNLNVKFRVYIIQYVHYSEIKSCIGRESKYPSYHYHIFMEASCISNKQKQTEIIKVKIIHDMLN